MIGFDGRATRLLRGCAWALGASIAVLGAGSALSSNPQAASSASAIEVPPQVIRRLTRVEYANSLRDLFGVDFPFVAELPADGQAEGFDNIGDALSLSPVLLESYLKVARKYSALVIGLGNGSPVAEQFPAKDSQSSWVEGLPLGTRGGAVASYHFPRTGEYELRALLNNDFGSAVEGVRLFRVRQKLQAGPHRFIATFPDQFAEAEGPVRNLDGAGGVGLGGPIDIRNSAIRPTVQFWLDGKKINTFEINGPTVGEAVDAVRTGPAVLARLEIVGPFNPEGKVDTVARSRLMSCIPKTQSQDKACAEQILAPLARRAFRRDIAADDMVPIMAAFDRKRSAGSFDEAIDMGVRNILMSPDFLFRVERAPASAGAKAPYKVSNYELATRLSYFVWSSMPDDELLEAARRQTLHDPQVLQQQLRRLLADSRSQALIDNFAIQWLGLRDFDTIRPDITLYPEFDDALGRAFDQETRLFLRSVLRENRSVLEVISSDYTYLNERLAELYGVPGVEGPGFRRVPLNGNDQRGGVLSQASVLMATSHAAQTSPILRGKWILANLLNAPPKPPPAGVPPLDTKPSSDGRALTTREQIERHRISPACVSCHVKMDPYGIALENYDVIGRWRTHENGSPIDTSTKLARSGSFTGPAGLKKVLLERKEDFVAATTTRLMTYALGRRLVESDAAEVKRIVEQTKAGGYRFADLVMGVAASAPFQTSAARLMVAKAEQQ